MNPPATTMINRLKKKKAETGIIPASPSSQILFAVSWATGQTKFSDRALTDYQDRTAHKLQSDL